MILTLTPNPSIDRTVMLDGELVRGQVHRVASVTSQAGGKGVNISRASVAAGVPSIAVLPAPKDDPFVLELLAAGIDCRPVDHPGDLRVDVAFVATNGITADHGLTTPDRDEAATKRAMVASARLVVVLADSSKVGTECPVRFARLDEVDVLVTDDGVGDEDRAALEQAGIEVVVA